MMQRLSTAGDGQRYAVHSLGCVSHFIAESSRSAKLEATKNTLKAITNAVGDEICRTQQVSL
jgi:hypothetical protein